MSLVLEIEFLTGVCRAAMGPGSDVPDWPPQPDRVFSALVSAWGVRGELSVERKALEWLEAQPSPSIRASAYSARTAPDVFVPPNDLKASTAMHTYLRVLPSYRPRQPRRFPVARPDDPIVEIDWPELPDKKVIDSLNAIASCVGYLGHSTSLTRCRFFEGNERKSFEHKSISARRSVYPGRLRELEEAHRARPIRPIIRPGASVFSDEVTSVEDPVEWLVLEAVKGEVPDIRASALVCRLLRQTLMSGYQRIGLANEIPEVVSGHSTNGTPTRHAHLSFVPMAFVGTPHADGRVLGFAIVPPIGEQLLRIRGFQRAFEEVAPYSSDEQRRILTLRGPPLHNSLRLAPAPDQGGSRQSLHSDPYLNDSRRWVTVTPIVLDRHLKRNDNSEVKELVALACARAGLPRPELDWIWAGKYSAIQGVPPARPVRGEPSWSRWRIPKSLESRQMVHAVIDFGEKVKGPVLLGAGRFSGLGLCRSVKR